MQRRQVIGSMAVAGFGLLARGTPAAGVAQDSSSPDLSFVHPELRAAARAIASADIRFSTETLARMRSGAGTQAFASLAGTKQLQAPVSVVEQRVPVPGGPEVTVYLINAAKGGSRPAILYTHGGGYIIGSANGEIAKLQSLAAELDCVIANVEYRLAPETLYTGSIEDNYAGLEWIYRHAKECGIDRDRIAVMGESAGGGHAALLALAARDRGKVPLCFQMLVYPMLDDRTGSTRMPGKNIGTFGWTAESNRFGWESFLGRKAGGDDVPPAGVPARVSNLAGLPPSFIQVGGIDLFVEEDIDYARRLISSGVPTELLVVPGAFHGFDIFAPSTHVAKRFITARVDALRTAFA